MGHSSKEIAKLIEGNYYDNIIAFLRFGSKVTLCAQHKEIFRRIERAEQLWLHHKEDAMVIKLLMRELKDEKGKPVSKAQAYNYLSDAKSLFVLMDAFDEIAELIILKKRIDNAFKLAEANGKEYGKLYSAAMLANSEWINSMRLAKERLKPDEPKSITNVYHTDWRELVDEETLAAWKIKLKKIKLQARSKNKSVVPEELKDVEYSGK